MSTTTVSLSASTLAKHIREGKLKIPDIINDLLGHIEKTNPSVNAISDLRPKEELLAEAWDKQAYLDEGNPTGLLFGVPVTIKESIMVKGLKLTNGDPLLKNYIAEEDAVLVKRLKDSGAIIIGMTNIAFLSIDWQSTNAWNGTTNNPHDLSRTAGGSSGGSSAAVAAHLSPISIGADAGGSIRVPAHFCGVYGLRPTENYLPNRGHLTVSGKRTGRRHIVTPGPFAKSIEDLQLSMKVLTDTSSHPASELPHVTFESSNWDHTPLNIAYSEAINGVEIDQEYLDLFRNFIKSLSSSGFPILEDHPDYDETESYLVYNKIAGFENGVNLPKIPFLSSWLMYLFIFLKYRDRTWALGMSKGLGLNNSQYAKAIDFKDEFSDNYDRFLTNYDIWITPVCALEAFEHQKAGKPFLINGKKVPYTKAISSYTFTTAFSGHPIVVIPIGKKENGLPVGVQIHARKWTDNRLLEIAKELERISKQNTHPNSQQDFKNGSFLAELSN